MKIIKLGNNPTLRELQAINSKIYSLVDDRFYDLMDILSNQQRFMMRALKGIRKESNIKLKENIIIASSWFIAIMNRLHIDLESILWKRFPYVCSYCGQLPCQCKRVKPKERKKSLFTERKMPSTLNNWQEMFQEIYPSRSRTLEQAGIHLAEEQGELSEAIQIFFGSHNKKYFRCIEEEAADYFSCLLAVYNSAGIGFEKEMKKFYSHNCHVCRKSPCECNFLIIAEYKS